MSILVGKKYILEFSTCPVDPGNARWHTARKRGRGNLEATWLLIQVIIWILGRCKCNVHHFQNQWPICSSKVLWATWWTSALLRSLGERAPGRLAHRDVHRHLGDNQDQLEDFFNQSDVKSLVIKFTFFKIASSMSRTTVARTKMVSMFDNSLGAENTILLILIFFCLEWNGTWPSWPAGLQWSLI